jgi:hypothetical protein
MHRVSKKPRALFLFEDGQFVREDEVCSGQFPSNLQGKPCPFSEEGRMPDLVPLDEQVQLSKSELEPGEEFVPACTLQRLGVLKGWLSVIWGRVPAKYQAQQLYKCRQMFLFVLLTED